MFVTLHSPKNDVNIWSYGTLERLHTLPNVGNVRAVCFSPDCLYIATGTTTHVQIWDIDSTALNAEWSVSSELLGESVSSLAFSPNMRFFAIGTDISVTIWENVHILPKRSPDSRGCGWELVTVPNSQHKACARKLPVTQRYYVDDDVLRGVEFSPDSKMVAIATRNKLYLRESIWGMPIRSWALFETYETPANASNHQFQLQFSPDGLYLAIRLNHLIEVRQVLDGSLVYEFDLNTLTEIQTEPGGLIAMCSQFDLNALGLMSDFKNCLACFKNTQRCIMTDGIVDLEAILWWETLKTHIYSLPNGRYRFGNASVMEVSPHGNAIVFWYQDEENPQMPSRLRKVPLERLTMCLLDIQTGTIRATMPYVGDKIERLFLSPNNQYVIAAFDECRSAWILNFENPEGGEYWMGFSKRRVRNPGAFAFTPDNRFLANTYNSPETRFILARNAHRSFIGFARFEADPAIRQAKEPKSCVLDQQQHYHILRFSPTGRYLVGATHHRLDVWEPNLPPSGICEKFLDHTHLPTNLIMRVRSKKKPFDTQASLDFSPDERLLASADADNVLRIWDVRRPRHSRPSVELKLEEGFSNSSSSSIAWSADSSLVMALSSTSLYVWDVSTKECILKGQLPERNLFTAVQNGGRVEWLFSSDYQRYWKLEPELWTACQERRTRAVTSEALLSEPSIPHDSASVEIAEDTKSSLVRMSRRIDESYPRHSEMRLFPRVVSDLLSHGLWSSARIENVMETHFESAALSPQLKAFLGIESPASVLSLFDPREEKEPLIKRAEDILDLDEEDLEKKTRKEKNEKKERSEKKEKKKKKEKEEGKC